ncbi:A/G-specific adenine glycosylase [Ancylobacter amanitiformis]|uniref:Adenine DNA glycosylase n=1 Tax=Ancylobacter amanitiformis TaxID=217069 RepID=A0ABU0LTI6_9HYPH|nr:A/G-specific adenine glycosylase [Ancylobacter amanitiformis]MDQ0512021.1 A/G-specific adenine glycosylase [Ancylobacter amanitiformis]
MPRPADPAIPPRPDPSRPAAMSAPDPGALLAWYDRHQRRLPWRAEPGTRQDPYRVFLSEIMLQQTTVVTVAPYYAAFLARWPSVKALAAAPLEEVLSAWAGLGYYARARNLHACARAVVERHGGAFPDTEAALLELPGIGPYTAAAIASIAFERRAAAVDGNWERVLARLFAVEEALPRAKARLRALALTLLPETRHGDFAQAMMDLGATLCTPRKPACALCPWQGSCAAHAAGAPERYPVKAAKSVRPTRQGVAFLAVRADGAVLVRSRPPRGLLGGMSEVPSTDWVEGGPADPALAAPMALEWQPLNAAVGHVFSHFALELAIWRARAPALTPAPKGHRWVRPEGFDAEAFPSVMRKVLEYIG